MTTDREPSLGGDKRIDTTGAEPKLGGEAAILHLVEMLKHDDRKVRYRAALKLAESGDDRVFDTLIEMLQDENGSPRLRERAALALGQLGDERAIEPLVASLDAIDSFYAVKAIIQIGGERAVDVVEELFYSHSSDANVARAIRDNLLKTSSQRTINFLLHVLANATSHNPAPGDLAATTLNRIPIDRGHQVIEPLLQLLKHESDHVRLRTLTALGIRFKDERLVESLINLLDDDHPRVAIAAIHRLGKLGDRRAVPPLIELLGHPAQLFVTSAARALGEIGDAHAVEPLLKLLDSPDPLIKSVVVHELGEIGDPRAVKDLEKALLDSEGSDVVDVAGALSAIGTDEALLTLDKAIHQSGVTKVPGDIELTWIALLRHLDPVMRKRAALELGRFPNKQAVEALNEALADQNVSVRIEAARSLRIIGDNQAVEPLLQVLHNDSDPVLEHESVTTLGKLGDPRAVEPLISIVKNQNSAARGNAANALAELGDKRAIEPLIEFLNEFDEDSWEAASALGDLGDECAIAPLKSVMYRADREMTRIRENEAYQDNNWLSHYYVLFKASEVALKQIGTPEALAAIEDLPFRDL